MISHDDVMGLQLIKLDSGGVVAMSKDSEYIHAFVFHCGMVNGEYANLLAGSAWLYQTLYHNNTALEVMLEASYQSGAELLAKNLLTLLSSNKLVMRGVLEGIETLADDAKRGKAIGHGIERSG